MMRLLLVILVLQINVVYAETSHGWWKDCPGPGCPADREQITSPKSDVHRFEYKKSPRHHKRNIKKNHKSKKESIKKENNGRDNGSSQMQ